MNWILYHYKGCGTCRKAIRWLEERGVAYEPRPIRETPPSPEELRAMLGHVGGELKRLFNTSGGDYRALDMKERLPALGEDEAVELLAGNGNLIKRPFLIGPGRGVVGFREAEWADLFDAN